jgi:uncharacterized repeat protein (TIGR02543 family)
LKKLITLVLFSTLLNVSAQNVIYVNALASGNNNGSSWTNAYTSLDSALAYSQSGDSIWVAKGIYRPDNKNKRFELLSGRNLFGGFAGTETQFAQRNVSGNATYLDGDINNLGQANDNVDNVLYANNLTSTAVVDGFTIRNGYQYTIGGSISNGGGGARISNSRVTFNHCAFTDNYTYMRGGAIYADNSSTVELNNCTFHNNSSGNNTQSVGGAVFVNSGTLRINGCHFYENRARYGGAIYTYSPNVTIDRTIFSGNEATAQDGGAIYIGSESSYTIYNSLFVGNYAEDNCAAIYTSTTLNTNSHRFINCTFADNFTKNSNGRTVNASDYTTVRNCIFWGNAASTPLFNLPPAIEPTVDHCIIEGGISYGSNNSDKNPLFINPGDYNNAPFKLESLDYGLKSNSPAINAGNNSYLSGSYTLDVWDSSRIVGNSIDLGAVESPYVTHTINTQSQNPEADMLAGAGSYFKDSLATISTTAKSSCFDFKHWLEADSIFSLDTSFTITVTSDRSFTSVYEQKQYQVTLTPEPLAGGSVLGAGTYGCSTDSLRSFMARPADCQQFDGWFDENGSLVSQDTNYQTAVTSAINLTAQFSQKQVQIQLIAIPSAGGSVSGAGTFPCDSFILIEANPNPGYSFEGWTTDGTTISTNASYAFNTKEDLSLIAEFKQNVGIYPIYKAIQILPNPASTSLRIEGLLDVQIVTILDPLGKAVYAEEDISLPLELRIVDWPQGVYTFLVEDSKGTYTARFVKN